MFSKILKVIPIAACIRAAFLAVAQEHPMWLYHSLWRDSGVVPTFGLLWTELLWTFVYKGLFVFLFWVQTWE